MKITVTKRLGPVSVFKFGLRNKLRNSRAFWGAVRQGNVAPIHQSSRPGAGTRILGECPLTSRLTSNGQQIFPTQRGIAPIAAFKLARDSERFVMTKKKKLRGQLEKKEAASSFFPLRQSRASRRRRQTLGRRGVDVAFLFQVIQVSREARS